MGSDAPRSSLPPERRLRRSGDFARIKVDGRRLAVGCLIANWRNRIDPGTSRLGVVTSKRIGSAVVRSRARRLLREAFRLNQNSLRNPVDLVLVARASIADKTGLQVQADLKRLLAQAHLLK